MFKCNLLCLDNPKGDLTTPVKGGNDVEQLKLLARKVNDSSLARIFYSDLLRFKCGTNQIETLTFKLFMGKKNLKCIYFAGEGAGEAMLPQV